jgi:hypothetical protein
MKTYASLICISILGLNSAIAAPAAEPKVAPAKSGAHVSFLNLKEHQTIPQKFTVKFAVEGMKLQPAGEVTPGTGHHHLIIDGDSEPAGQVVPSDATHLHFGKGQTEAALDLKPGPHKLTLQFANGAHVSYGPDLSKSVDVIVK